ncbi:MAG: NUDIX hydrolase [Patescibacteria group bacterium]|jgi:8-oxo-dGTP pyrophosphatase MutT (NUDIX family)
MKHPWKKISSKIVYKNPWIKVQEDKVIRPDGSKGIYGVIDTKRSVIVLAIEGKNIYLVKQYRYPVKKWFLEVCCGGNSRHEKDSILQLAKSELREEIGLTAKKWEMIGKYYPFNALINEIVYIYLAQDLESVGNCLDDDEFLEIKKMSIKKFGHMVESGKIEDAFSIIAYYKLKEYLKL